jgi:hypothetical protein
MPAPSPFPTASRRLARRALPFLLAAAVLLPGLALWEPAPPAAAQAEPGAEHCPAPPQRPLACIEPLHADPAILGLDENLYSIAWRPVRNPYSGLWEALIVGGTPSGNPGVADKSVALVYDGVRVSKVWDREGPPMVDVAWSLDGDYALVVTGKKDIYRVDGPAAGASPHPDYKFTNLWGDCQHVQIQNCQQAVFFGHKVRFNPVAGYAWITGSSLLEYNGKDLSVVDEGSDIAWRALAWSPSGTRALLSALVCVDENDTAVDAPCVGNLTAGRLVPGRIAVADTAQQKLCEVFTYGRFDVTKAEVNSITWDPTGSYAFIYGDDDFHGTILKFDNTVPPTGSTSGGCPRYGNSFHWLPFVKPEGEFNDMDYDPETGRFLAVAGAGQEVWEGNASIFYDMFGEHDITGSKGTIYYSVRWDPTHTYYVIAGYQGRLWKVVPANLPFTRTSTPKNNTLVTGDVPIAGKSYAPSQFEPIGKVEVRINGPHGDGPWNAVNITGRYRAVANWSVTWPTDLLEEGFYQVQARAFVGNDTSNISNRTVQVVRTGGLQAPRFELLPPEDGDGNYTLRWSLPAPPAGVVYDLEEAGLPSQYGAFSDGAGTVALTQDYAFAGDERLVYNGTAASFSEVGKKDGQYFYRVRARTESPPAVSVWSAAMAITVAIDTDGDGFPDAREVACGSSVLSATSNCNDVDGDGLPNAADAFPNDPAETQDRDGDGVGDHRDAFPLDPRDWSDADQDGFGDSAEKRLGSDAFHARSTPETDDDNDGCLNQDEAAAKTDPKDPASGPAFCKKAGPAGLEKGAPGFEPLLALGAGCLAVAARRRLRRRP